MKIFTPLSIGQSSTLIIPRGFGGGKALTRFMIENVDQFSRVCGLPVSRDKYQYVYVDADELSKNSVEEVIGKVHEKLLKVGEARVPGVSVDTLKHRIAEVITEKDLVIIIRGIPFISFEEACKWAILRSLQIYPERVHFLFIVYRGGDVDLHDKQFDRIRDLMTQNVIAFNHLTEEDVDYSIHRWGFINEVRFSEAERKEIAKESGGWPARIKEYCVARAHGRSSGSVERGKQDGEWDRVRGGKLDREPDFVGRDVPLSENEMLVYEMMVKNRNRVVLKEDLGDVMWGGRVVELYSEAAIVQVVRRLRKKLRENGNKSVIRSVYGRGYVLTDRT